MKVVNSGNTFDVYDDSLQTFDELPVQSYVVRFQDRRGFYLEKYFEIGVNEPKVYGAHNEKADKVLRTFSSTDRNLGVILSGDKGIGKSLFAKLLTSKAVESGLPVIVVDKYVAGIASYLESVNQSVLVLFDEFDKTFGFKQKDGEIEPQAEMLSLFDGVSGGKKLFVITCNDLKRLNEYLVNRPGRFHYHFRFDYPDADGIKEYLADKLDSKYYDEIDSVVNFSHRVPLNYDCLRSIAFELNNGEKFKDAIHDLNIVNLNESERYDLTLNFANGLKAYNWGRNIDLDDQDSEHVWFSGRDIGAWVCATFTPSDAVFDTTRMCYIIPLENIRYVSYDSDGEDGEEESRLKELIECAKSTKIECISLKRQKRRDLHYAV